LATYEILAPIGAGGMGQVYRARDSRLEREVAIKVLSEHLAKDHAALARFEREAKAVAALNHPNILAIHGFGDHDGISYAVMELLEGETLRSRLSRSLPAWQETVEIAAAIAEGLAAAHAKGIIHRDLKPENVFLTSDGRVKILDFGLASWEPSDTVSENTAVTTLTQPGTVMGTVAYMSPEQVRCLAAGAPSDIFALGCVLFEMLTGRRAFDRPTSAEILVAILSEEPPQLSGSGRLIPVELERVVTHCLEKKPQARYQSARDLAFSLRAVGTRLSSAPAAAAQSSDAIESLAVLPFVNAGGNPDTEYLSDGITESLINSLSQIPNLRVAPRSKAFRYKGQDVDPEKAGRELRVSALLTGKVFARGDTLSVQAELVDVVRDCQLWGERFQRKSADIFTVEEEIAKQIVEKLRLKLSGQTSEGILKRHTDDTEAYHLYLKGRFHWNKRTGDGLRRAIEYFQEAIEKDPGYALAHAGLADGFLVLSFYDPSPAKAYSRRGKAAAMKALEICPDLVEALSPLGMTQAVVDWNWAEAERNHKRALELNPDYWLAHTHYAIILSATGRHEEALSEVRRGLELEPLTLVASHHFAWVSIRAGHYAQAADQCRIAIELDPHFAMGHYWLGLTCELQTRYDEAIAELETADRSAGNTFVSLELARVYAISGRTEDARRMLAEMHRKFEQSYADPYGFAIAYAALGDVEQAFQWLERASQDHAGMFNMWVNGDPRLESLQGDPQMEELLRRMGLRPGRGARDGVSSAP
jgi:serine/threonine protein kinase/Tfp pilus assembly protein PilF